MRTLIIGLGSIGERHLTVLQSLGERDIAVLRSRGLPPRSVDEASFTTLRSWEEAIAWKPEAVIICTPTSRHAEEAARCLQLGWHVLVEKPLGALPEEIALVDAAHRQAPDRQLRVAYMLPFYPHMQRVQQIVHSGELGRLVAQHTYWGEYLPEWHPWEDYRQSYAALRSLGGGATLTLSHDLDLCCSLADSPVEAWFRMENHASGLEVDTESASDVSIRFTNGSTAHCHLSFHDRSSRRHYRFVFQEGVVEIDYLAGTLQILRNGEAPIVENLTGWERNDMFRAQWQAFLAQVERGDQAETDAQIRRSELLLTLARR